MANSNQAGSASHQDKWNAVDKPALGRLRAGTFCEQQFLTSRLKEELREVRDATWLAFLEERNADAFIAEFGRYGLVKLLAAVQRRIATIAYNLDQK